jgi:hypothetical protein
VRGSAGVSAAERDFRFLCSVAELPDDTIKEINVPYFGRRMKFAGEREFANFQVTVLNDEDFKVKLAFEAWMKAIADHSTTVSQFDGGITSGSYVTDGLIKQYSRNQGGSPLHAYKFVGMFPVSVGKIALGWDATESIETFPVTFAYQWWESVDASTGATL